MANKSDDSIATYFFQAKEFNLDGVRLLPGEYFVTQKKMALVTVLGSCVAACVRDKFTGVGGMNHFMLPEGGDGDERLGRPARFGTYAMELLINQLLRMGADRRRLEAKIFGGGRVLEGMAQTQVGERNVAFVLGYFALEGIPISAQDVLDDYPRKVCYLPHTGQAFVKKLRLSGRDEADSAERAYLARLRGRKVGGDVELFV